jgi:CRP-like cAMP-binding protein
MDVEGLKDLPLFTGLSKRDLELVARHADRAAVKAGTVLMTEGDRGLEVMIILAGMARVTHGGQVLADVGPGSVVGEIGVMANQPRDATVEALTDLDLIVMFGPEFREVVDEVPSVRDRVLAIIHQRMLRS